VARSALGRTWTERCDSARAVAALAIAQTHGVPDVLARVLAGRGVAVADTPAFLNPRLRDLMPDPHRLTDMEAAAARLADAVGRRETVAIFGDYDVDGACSAALLAEYLSACDVPYLIHIPDRITEGYGPNIDAIRTLKERGAGLLVTVDCGTASHGPLAEAARLGLDALVLDHHQAPEQLPAVRALVNPNRLDCLSGLGHLCAAGVVFLTLVALNRTLRLRGFWSTRREPDLMASLDLVALATVADVVPLQGLNRAFVRQGLQVMRARGRVGLAALFDAAGLNGVPECWHLGYLVGRASTRAGASATRRSARRSSSRRTRFPPGGSRASSTGSTASARSSSRPPSKPRRRRPGRPSTPRRTRPSWSRRPRTGTRAWSASSRPG
jgi:single-stranded-DNA-specific exonuclease